MLSRRPLAVASAAVAVLALSGCGLFEKPTPYVTVYAEGSSVSSQATAYCHEDDGTDCEEFPDRELQTLEVKAGKPFSIDVDKDLAEAGWTIGTPGDQTVLPPTKVYYSQFTFPTGVAQPLRLEVYEVGQGPTPGRRGTWAFQLIPTP